MFLELDVVEADGRSMTRRFEVADLVLAGYTARSKQARDEHIDELRELGVPPPSEVPAFWPVSAGLLTTRSRLQVRGRTTSGEVEFVLLHLDDLYVGVGSDHTDRELERHSVPASKQACGKVISRSVVRYSDVRSAWDSLRLVFEVFDDGRWRAYQDAPLALVVPPEELLERCCGPDGPRPGTVLMSGTVPLLNGVTIFARQYRGALRMPGWREELAFGYSVEVVDEPA